jgi:hypothetical protein
MKEDYITLKIFAVYLFILAFMLFCGTAFGQIQIVYFNADWNKANGVKWISDLEDVRTLAYIDVANDKELQKKHKIAVIPTIILFKDDEEVARFQADLSFKMVATREEVQEEIDNQLMSDF